MNTNNLYLILCFLIIFFACNTGKKHIISDGKKRIISLSPHITEIIYELGEEEQLVAVTDFCTYPPDVIKKNKIGGFLNPDLEKIVALQPTHIFGQLAHDKLNKDLKLFGLSIVMMPNETIGDVIATIRTIGSELSCEMKAQLLAQRLLDTLNHQEKRSRLPKAMLVIGKNKDELKNITVAGPATFIDEIWQRAGGQNIYYDLPGRYQTITLESIFLRDPEIIILFDPSAAAGINRSSNNGEWALLEPVTALRKNNIYTLGGDYVLIPGPRLIQLLQDMREVIVLSEKE